MSKKPKYPIIETKTKPNEKFSTKQKSKTIVKTNSFHIWPSAECKEHLNTLYVSGSQEKAKMINTTRSFCHDKSDSSSIGAIFNDEIDFKNKTVKHKEN